MKTNLTAECRRLALISIFTAAAVVSGSEMVKWRIRVYLEFHPPIALNESAGPQVSVFSGPIQTPAPAVPEKTAPDAGTTGPDRLILLGTVSGDPQSSFAIIQDRIAGTQALFRLGQQVGGGILEKILRDRVVIALGSRKVTLRTRSGTGEVEEGKAGPAVEVAASEIDAALADFNRTLSQVRIRALAGGAGQGGIEIVTVAPDSIYARMGIRPGDVVQKVNGVPIENPQLFTRLQERMKTLPLDISLEGLVEDAPGVLSAVDPQARGITGEVTKLVERLKAGEPVSVALRRGGRAETLSYRMTPD